MKLNSHRAADIQLNFNSMVMPTQSQFKSTARPTSTQTLKSLTSKHLLGPTGKIEKRRTEVLIKTKLSKVNQRDPTKEEVKQILQPEI